MKRWMTTLGGRRTGTAGPMLLIGTGVAFLAANMGWVENVGRYWPLLVILLGGSLLFDRLRG